MSGTNGPNGHNGNGRNHDGTDLLHYVGELTEREQDVRSAVQARRKLLDVASAHGLHRQALREVVRRRLETHEQAEKRETYRERFDAYLEALGMRAGVKPRQATTPADTGPDQPAVTFLRGALGELPVPASRIEEQAARSGIGTKQLERARAVLGVKVERRGDGQGVCYFLPS